MKEGGVGGAEALVSGAWSKGRGDEVSIKVEYFWFTQVGKTHSSTLQTHVFSLNISSSVIGCLSKHKRKGKHNH